jgi:acetyl-CoA acetyltransferase
MELIRHGLFEITQDRPAYLLTNKCGRCVVSFFPRINVENWCSSASNAFREVYFGVTSGRIDTGLAIDVENLTNVLKGPMIDKDDLEGLMGNSFTALYAQRALRYIWEYGLKPEHLAKIAVISKGNGYYL